jgi:heme oxygenase
VKPQTLTARLKDATRELHREAERASGMSVLLRGRLERAGYCAMLRNLHALYAALEAALERHRQTPFVAPVGMPALYRTMAIAADLDLLHGPAWNDLPLTEAMRTYVLRLDELARTQPPLLAAHAYVRYMGDLSGGQILRDVVRRALDLPDGAGTAFYRFADEDAGTDLKETLRAALDALPVEESMAAQIVAEARDSFARHIRLFEELDRASVAQG